MFREYQQWSKPFPMTRFHSYVLILLITMLFLMLICQIIFMFG